MIQLAGKLPRNCSSLNIILLTVTDSCRSPCMTVVPVLLGPPNMGLACITVVLYWTFLLSVEGYDELYRKFRESCKRLTPKIHACVIETHSLWGPAAIRAFQFLPRLSTVTVLSELPVIVRSTRSSSC